MAVGLEKIGKKGNAKCLKRIIIHNPEKQAYCVIVFDTGKSVLKLVSWHNAKDMYGTEKWSLK